MKASGKMDEEVQGFSLPAEDGDDEIDFPAPKQSKQKGGGFQCLGLGFEVLKGIKKRGYKVPTPIQRKVHKPSIQLFLFVEQLDMLKLNLGIPVVVDDSSCYEWKRRCGYGSYWKW